VLKAQFIINKYYNFVVIREILNAFIEIKHIE
jgi:hypothetical protein